MKIIVLKGNEIISEFTNIIFNELKQFYSDIEYHDSYNTINKDILHFIISPQNDDVLPNRYILYNLEPLYFRKKTRKDYIKKIQNAEIVWEYSMSNMEILKTLNKNILYQPFLYSKFMENIYNIDFQKEKDIDVLFYGLMSPRRIRIIQKLERENINVVCPNYPKHNPVWGKEKYELISRAKIVINMHYHYDIRDQTNDLLRIMFLLANKIQVVQEETCDKDIDNQMENIIVPYDHIITRCKELLKLDVEELKKQAGIDYENIKTKMFFNLNGILPK